MSYANTTVVPVERSKSQIEALLVKYGAEGYHTGWQAATADEPGWDAIEFLWKNRTIRFRLPRAVARVNNKTQPWAADRYGCSLSGTKLQKAIEQRDRQRWRVLFLVIKAKLEAVENGIGIFEEEFMAFIVTGNGKTVGEVLLPRLAAGSGPLMLEPGS